MNRVDMTAEAILALKAASNGRLVWMYGDLFAVRKAKTAPFSRAAIRELMERALLKWDPWMGREAYLITIEGERKLLEP